VLVTGVEKHYKKKGPPRKVGGTPKRQEMNKTTALAKPLGNRDGWVQTYTQGPGKSLRKGWEGNIPVWVFTMFCEVGNFSKSKFWNKGQLRAVVSNKFGRGPDPNRRLGNTGGKKLGTNSPEGALAELAVGKEECTHVYRKRGEVSDDRQQTLKRLGFSLACVVGLEASGRKQCQIKKKKTEWRTHREKELFKTDAPLLHRR